MHVAGAKHRPLQVTELVEYEERMVAGEPKVAVEGRAFLLTKGRAVEAVHVENQILEGRALIDPVDPMTGEVR